MHCACGHAAELCEAQLPLNRHGLKRAALSKVHLLPDCSHDTGEQLQVLGPLITQAAACGQAQQHILLLWRQLRSCIVHDHAQHLQACKHVLGHWHHKKGAPVVAREVAGVVIQ